MIKARSAVSKFLQRSMKRMHVCSSAAVAARPGQVQPDASPGPHEEPDPRGTADGWLRVLDHAVLLQSVRAGKAVGEIRRQSRLSLLVWQRDFVPALARYAEFVQLVPASEAHHHAHAGGLLSHTVEMTLAAVSWRNGHLLPAGEPIEVIDAHRDAWTYVVFFAALLHDIAKPMTDLRIVWRARGMAEPLRWLPLTGSLTQVTGGRPAPEYLVEFAPKSARDYAAHARLAMTLLPVVAPPSALSFLASHPAAFDALNQYLTGQDADSLLAQIIRKADRASTERSLLVGSRARFVTATAVPLIDLLMQAIAAMLRTGTSLPLNRTGAAGWVYDDSIWFVAKRLADSVRGWITTHAPEAALPGDGKNDRLFDTWQQHGCIESNPVSGQAVWYVTVHGVAAGPEAAAAVGAGGLPQQSSYDHSLTMLRFPLAKLYGNPSDYPAAMHGRIEVHAKRPTPQSQATEAVASSEAEPFDAAQTAEGELETAQSAPASHGSESPADRKRLTTNTRAAPGRTKERTVREPSFKKLTPPPASVATTSSTCSPAAAQAANIAPLPVEAATWLDADDDVSAAVVKLSQTPGRRAHTSSLVTDQENRHQSVASSSGGNCKQPTAEAQARALLEPSASVESMLDGGARSGAMLSPPVPLPTFNSLSLRMPTARSLPPNGDERMPAPTSPMRSQPIEPVVLLPKLPALLEDGQRPVPSEQAIEFMQWLQASLVNRRITYNETGAAVHFTTEGMALVSPLIFKTFARERAVGDDADERGLQVQREVLKAGWHMSGASKSNIICYQVVGRGGSTVSRLSAVVLVHPDRWVVPVPPTNPVLKLV